MTESWKDMYDTITPQAKALLRAVIAVETTKVAELAAALGCDSSEAARLGVEVHRAGWTRQATGSEVVLHDAARLWLTYDTADHVGGHTLAAEDARLVSRYVRYHLAKLDRVARQDAAAWAGEHRDDIVAALRAGVRTGHHDLSLRLAHATWRVAGDVDDPTWHHELAEAGERTTHDHRDQLLLIRSSADTALAHGDLATAEHQYGRATGISLRLGDRANAIDTLTILVRILRDRGQPGRALDALLELADLHRQAGNTIDLASTLTQLGTTMLVWNRPQASTAYLDQADKLLSETPDAHNAAGLHARVLELRGRALWMLGKTILARRQFSRAETLLRDATSTGDTHEPARDRLRELLALRRDAPLPDLDPTS